MPMTAKRAASMLPALLCGGLALLSVAWGQAVTAERPARVDCTGEKGVSAEEMRQAQAAWAHYLGRPVEDEVELAPGVKVTVVLVPPGKFRMGSPNGENERLANETLRTVTLMEPFDLGKYEVTQAQYEALIGNNPSHVKAAGRPVENVTWQEARAFVTALTKKRDDAHVYRLPTEAQWEYACRAGHPSSQPFGVGNGSDFSSRLANFNGQYFYGRPDRWRYLGSTCQVGMYAPNVLGLYDMHGNVGEWCADHLAVYPAADATDPYGPDRGTQRVVRGGSWNYPAGRCRAAYRQGYPPGERYSNVGFRLARSLPSGAGK
jgi:formylglycine-generating enzyme required for sulfatase activity